jgi:chorismate-pyruvate lyase
LTSAGQDDIYQVSKKRQLMRASIHHLICASLGLGRYLLMEPASSYKQTWDAEFRLAGVARRIGAVQRNRQRRRRPVLVRPGARLQVLKELLLARRVTCSVYARSITKCNLEVR